jgi:hypothetical protein
MATAKTYGCDQCRTHNKANLEKIGKQTEHTYAGGKAYETQTRYRCRFCGTHWINYIESGFGGHGNSWATTTPNEAT